MQEDLAIIDRPENDPSHQLTSIEERDAVYQALAQLPANQRRPIEMAYYGGLTQVEIAAALNEPLGTVKTRMRLGMQKLRGLLAGESGFQRAGSAAV